MNSTLNNKNTTHQEFTFPELIPTKKCISVLHELNDKTKSFLIIFYAILALCLILFILTLISFFSNITSSGLQWDETIKDFVEIKADYTFSIIFLIFFLCSLIGLIINIFTLSKYRNQINYLKASIKINKQYSAFINQGYDKKDAYKLTLEWIDRQTNNAVLNNIAMSNTLIAMSSLFNIKNN